MYVLSRNMKKYQIFLFKHFLLLELKISIYLNRRVFVMSKPQLHYIKVGFKRGQHYIGVFS